MGLEEVKKGLDKDLEKQKKAIMDEAEQEKTEITREQDKTIKEYEQVKREQQKSLISLMERKERASTNLLVKKQVLHKKKEIIDQVFVEVMKRLQSYDAKKRKKMIMNLIKEAKQKIDLHYIYCSKKDVNLMPSGYTVEAIDISGGIICENKDKTSRLDLTYEAYLEDVRNNHLKEIAEKLF